MTDKKMTIHEAFCAAQQKIGGARKTSTNPHFKSKYADLKECFNACSDILNEYGIHISQPTMQEGDLFVIRTILTHTSGEAMQDFGVPIVGWQGAKNPAQAFGSGQTYARRYGLCGMVGIAPEDDDGESLTQDKPQAPKTITTDQASEIKNLIKESNQDVEKLLAYTDNATSVDEMPAKFYEEVIKSLKKKVAE
tara:strand:- start:107 stop:688 length:582 start_codon:yes stop_codon:yes gene_type:complete